MIAGDVDDLGEYSCLAQPVLAGCRVEDQQDLVDRAVLLDHPLDLAELVHQPGLGVQPAGGVDDARVSTPSLDADVDGLEGDAGRVGAFPVRAHDLGADPVSPGLQLVHGRGAEGVGGPEHNRLAVADEDAGRACRRWWSCRCR